MPSLARWHERAELVEPFPDVYLYVGLSVDPPVHLPIVRHSKRRERILEQCRTLVRDAEALEAVADATVFETVLIPPVPGVPRFDIVLLVRADTADAQAQVRNMDLWSQLDAEFVMSARNIRRIGDTEQTRSATFLFNHFTAPEAADPVTAWENVAGWYTAKTGVDNSTLLQPTGDAPYALVNYVRLPHSGAGFMINQLSRPSFHSHVRRTLKDNGMVALPLLCKPA